MPYCFLIHDKKTASSEKQNQNTTTTKEQLLSDIYQATGRSKIGVVKETKRLAVDAQIPGNGLTFPGNSYSSITRYTVLSGIASIYGMRSNNNKRG